ncbi:unnamed protein product [Closterium sp. NIES-54]
MERLRAALTAALVLILSDPDRDYVVEENASDQAVGALLMQDQGCGLQPMAYLSKKLHGAELNYPIHDKEALAIVTAFKEWRCYLEGAKTTVYTDHCSLKYLKSQPTLSRRQVWWVDFLEAHFHYDIVYKRGLQNKVDAFSRPDHVAGIQLDGMNPLLYGLFRHGYFVDAEIATAQKHKLLQWEKDLAIWKGSRKIWVPYYTPLRQILLEEFHDVAYVGHFGSNKTLAGIANYYYWPQMAADVQQFVTSCDTCQWVKSSKQNNAGLLQPLPVPEQPWHGKQYADQQQCDHYVAVRDQVLLDTRNLDLSRLPSKLRPRFCGPFCIEEKVTQATFRLRLPTRWKLHNAFHVQLWNPYKDPNQQFQGRQLPPPPPVLVQGEPEY